jgi:glucoamylase
VYSLPSSDNCLLILFCADTVSLPANTAVQYKYIRKNNGAVTWSSDPNFQITTPASGSATENDSWR